MSDIIAAIWAAFDPSNATEIPKSKILDWMKNKDVEVRGALYHAISESPRIDQIVPAMEFIDYYGFVIPFLAECIVTDPDGDWTHGRSIAGQDLMNWFVGFWNDSSVPREKITEMKSLLSELYKNGVSEVRDVVTNSILEHLFERPDIRGYFEDWRHDPELAEAYRDAAAWTDDINRTSQFPQK